MSNRLELTEAFVNSVLAAAELAPASFVVPVAFGVRVGVTLDPRQVRLAGDTIVVPLQPGRGPRIRVELRFMSFADGMAWWRVGEVSLGGVPVPVAGLLHEALRRWLGHPDLVMHEGGRLGIAINRYLAVRRVPMAIRHLELHHGLRVELDAAPPAADEFRSGDARADGTSRT